VHLVVGVEVEKHPHCSSATCRAWAQGIFTTWPDIDGPLAPSTMTGRPLIAAGAI
jgi:hypothetical protein